jgi:hypothetical protein
MGGPWARAGRARRARRDNERAARAFLKAFLRGFLGA